MFMSRTSRYALYREQKGKRSCVLPPVRLHPIELNWLKEEAKRRGLSFSEFARLRLLHPVTLRRQHPSSVSTHLCIEPRKKQRKKGWYAPPGEALADNSPLKGDQISRTVRRERSEGVTMRSGARSAEEPSVSHLDSIIFGLDPRHG